MELKFNSQICTTKEQSKRLLELGLKPETADMVLFKTYDLPQYPFDYTFNQDPSSLNKIRYIPTIKGEQPFVQDGNIPAWSLHRLFDIMYVHCHELKACENVYDAMIKRIEKTIEHNTHNEYYFNREYLNK